MYVLALNSKKKKVTIKTKHRTELKKYKPQEPHKENKNPV